MKEFDLLQEANKEQRKVELKSDYEKKLASNDSGDEDDPGLSLFSHNGCICIHTHNSFDDWQLTKFLLFKILS